MKIIQDDERLQFISAIKIVRSPKDNKEYLYALSNRLTAFRQRVLNFDNYNYFILISDVESLISKTNCV